MNACVEQINTMGKVFIDFAVPMLVQSSVLIVILLVLDLLLRKRIRAVFRYWIWMIVLIKLVLPPTLSLPTSPAYWIGHKIHNPVSSSQIPEENQTYSYAAYTETLPYHDIGASGYSMKPTSYVEKFSPGSSLSILFPAPKDILDQECLSLLP